MDFNFSVFQEPRGVMRIIQFIFSICAFATTCNYVGSIDFECQENYRYTYGYPYQIELSKVMNLKLNTTCKPKVTIMADYSSDAKFFVATGVIAMLYSLAIALVYIKFDEMYKVNTKIPLADFVATVFIAILWLSSSASWANSLSGIKHVTDKDNMRWDNTANGTCTCGVSISSFSNLNISVVLGFLNFILWASDLWFLYKETVWFQNPNGQVPSGN
jgi:hypothetical protein